MLRINRSNTAWVNFGFCGGANEKKLAVYIEIRKVHKMKRPQVKPQEFKAK